MIVRDGICYPDAPARHVKIVGAEVERIAPANPMLPMQEYKLV